MIKRVVCWYNFRPGATIAYRNRFEKLLACLRQNDEHLSWNIAVEFRNREWYRDDIYNLLDKYNIGRVIHDLPSSAAPFIDSSANFAYLRFHGPESNYRGSYSDDFLAEYAGYISGWQQEGKIVYAYFNNTLGDALRNLTTLNNLLNNIRRQLLFSHRVKK